MKCISCDNTLMNKISEKSYLGLPVFQCEKCKLSVTGDSLEDIKNKTKKIYEEKHWGKNNLWDAKNAVESDYTDIDSQGKKRHWISQFKYCKPFFEDNDKILEIGAGQGQATYWFENKGFLVTAIEPDKNNVELINKKLNKGHSVLGTAEDYEINGKFEVIWMSHVLEHVLDPEKVLKKIHNNLTEDGILFIEVPNCENPTMLRSSIFLVPHTFHFSKKSLITLAVKTGFQVVKTDYFRPATKIEGGLHKIFNDKFKKFQYYPRIISNNKEGRFLRIIMKLKHN